MENKDIGALWAREKDGKEYFTGTIQVGENVLEIVVFKNSYKKEGERTPDWRIYPSRPRPDAANGPTEDIDASSIPF